MKINFPADTSPKNPQGQSTSINLSNIQSSKSQTSSPTQSPDKSAKTQKQKNFKRLFFILIILLLIVSIGAGSFFYFSQNNKSTSPIASILPIPTAEPTPTPTPEPIFYPNPITGELIPEARFNEIQSRPFLAVMIQNNTASRPEYGLNEADIMYESLVESSITRFMGVYWSNDVERVQSIRSARKYFVELLGDYNNPAYLHIGFADTGDPRTDALLAMNRNGIRRIGELRDSTNKELAYSRDKACERVKAVEHCAYTDTARLWRIASQQNWQNDLSKFKSWKFVKTEELKTDQVKDLTDFTVDFRLAGTIMDKNYSARWKYDQITQKYQRFNIDNTPYVDGKGAQITTNTIIYQKVNSFPANDGKGRQVQEVIGKGSGYVMMQGKVYPVNWSKPDFKTRTVFTDPATGQEFNFQKGRIWVMVMPKFYDYTDNTPKATLTPTASVNPTR